MFSFAANDYFEQTELTKTYTIDNFMKGDTVLRDIDGYDDWLRSCSSRKSVSLLPLPSPCFVTMLRIVRMWMYVWFSQHRH